MDSRTGSYKGGGGGEGSGSGSTPYSDVRESESISIDINKKINDWSNSCKKQPVHQQRIPIPSMQSKSKRHLFEPHVIRIGPYHPPDKYLKTDPLKLGFVDSLCSSAEIKEFVGVCTEKMYGIAERVMDLYDQNDAAKDRKEFVKRLVIDGCFIVEYLNQREKYLESAKSSQNHDNRLLIDIKHMIPLIDDDLLLLKNQLPLFVLKKIHKLAFPKKDDFTKTAFSFISSFLSTPTNLYDSSPDCCLLSKAQHLLGMFHNISIKTMARATESDFELEMKRLLREYYHAIIYLPSATTLRESGIELKRLSEGSILSVNFKHGALNIPRMVVSPTMLRLLKNLCEMEKLCPSFDPYFTAYVEFMDRIINTQDDIAILQGKRIIRHTYGSDKEAADRINELMSGESSILQDNYLLMTYLKVNRKLVSKRWVSKRWMRMMWASFKERYFSNPWSFIALVSAIILLVLTFLQTYYTLRGYYYPPHA